ncbi:DUF4349 domain-containing protein [Ktedonobacteria bacterium brp13]|nr:DUF4349 domain-containing protein [Ktedonobacteria bacterium brp13]
MRGIKKRSWQRLLWPLYLSCLFIVLAACGSGNTGAAGSTASGSSNSFAAKQSASNASAGASSASGTTNTGLTQNTGPNYLIKTLSVSMNVTDTRSTANDIQEWISTKDPRSTSAGVNYNQDGNNLYTISMTFAVQATLYPQVYAYLRDYNLHNGQLTNFHETVQDVSNDYVDTQSRITVYQGERDRLLGLLKQTQSASDVVTIEQRLSDVEQSLESTESHLNLLNSQVAFYNVTIQLQPLAIAEPVIPPNQPWTIWQTFHAAWTAVLGLGQVLLVILIWLLTFSVYIIPLFFLIWLFVRWRERKQSVFSRPAPAPASVSARAPMPPKPMSAPVATPTPTAPAGPVKE